jgi:uncharacterized protein
VPSKVDRLIKNELVLSPPHFLKNSVQYEAVIGSVAYGVSTDTSDVDLYGFCIPPKEIVFPHLNGVIFGFDTDYKKFNQYQQHHVKDKEARKDYDIVIYNIIKYFRLCADGNPNMIDSLFVPRRCVLHSTKIGEMVRESRHLFLSKKCWSTHKGYAYSQVSKMTNKNSLGVKIRKIEEMYNLPPNVTLEEIDDIISDPTHKELYKKLLKELKDTPSKRHQAIREIGYDVKFGYHVVRLINQVEQILIEHDLDLERNREQLKSIRRGEWTQEQIQDFFTTKERTLEDVYIKSKLRQKPAIEEIKELLMNCLEEYFGRLDFLQKKINSNCTWLIRDIEEVLAKYA